MNLKYTVRIAQELDVIHSSIIAFHIDNASKDPLSGICKRSKQLIEKKMINGEAVIAVTNNNKWLGFCYLHSWADGFVSTCGLIVSPKYRKGNIAKHLKEKILELAKEKYPAAKYFGLTTSLAVMKINSAIGYEPVPYSEITKDDQFWNSCSGCTNHSILIAKQKKNCLCTAMLLSNK